MDSYLKCDVHLVLFFESTFLHLGTQCVKMVCFSTTYFPLGRRQTSEPHESLLKKKQRSINDYTVEYAQMTLELPGETFQDTIRNKVLYVIGMRFENRLHACAWVWVFLPQFLGTHAF